MHLKSDFKANILWENIVLIIHLKISWRWFIACCKKGSQEDLTNEWGGQSLFIKPERLGLLLFSSSIFEIFHTDYFSCCCFVRKISFHDIFHTHRGSWISQWVFSAAILCWHPDYRKSFKGKRRCVCCLGVWTLGKSASYLLATGRLWRSCTVSHLTPTWP